MTLIEYDQKIDDLKVVRVKTTGLKKARLTSIIDHLITARVEALTYILNADGFGFSSEDIAELKDIATIFEEATGEIDEANQLVDNAISLGKKLVDLLA